MNISMELRSDVTYTTASNTSAARKRKPETPVKKEGSMSECLSATQRKRNAEAMSTTSMKQALTRMAVVRSSDHSVITTIAQMLRTQHSARLRRT